MKRFSLLQCLLFLLDFSEPMQQQITSDFFLVFEQLYPCTAAPPRGYKLMLETRYRELNKEMQTKMGCQSGGKSQPHGYNASENVF